MEIDSLRRLYEKRKAWGMSASIDLSGCDHQLIQSPAAIRNFVRQLLELIKMKAYGPLYLRKFGDDSLEGYSAVQFIETSSVTIHFDDKLGDRAFIDIFSCKFFDPFAAERFAQKYFKAKKGRNQVLLRH